MAPSNWQEYWKARQRPFIDECRTARAELLADLEDPAAAQDRVLRDIIDISADSLFWKEQKYATVRSAASEFRTVLPIMRYDDFAPVIERETRTKGGVLTCSPVLRWLKTSGTTGVPKRVPYTLHWLLNYRIPAMKAMWGNHL
jgi:acyl-coenzyme A synthetase/AMP-(fatty) acid ligase